MSKILFVWELGGGYGHLYRLSILATALHQQGHDISFIVRDLKRANYVLEREGFPVLQAPIHLHKSALPISLNYAEVLFRCGYQDHHALAGLFKAWRLSLEQVQPHLLIADHSPTALLAARSLGIKRILIGTSFQSPPHTSPMPSLQPWKKVSRQNLLGSEEKALRLVNNLLRQLNIPTLENFAEVLSVDKDFLCTFPELDHYGSRQNAKYWGPVIQSATGNTPDWPKQKGEKIFVYISASHAQFKYLINHLNSLKLPVLVYARDLPTQFIDNWQSPYLTFAREPVDLSQVVKQCRLVISHGGHGTSATMLLAGIPMLIIPQHLEQTLLGYRLAQQGLAVMVNPVEKQIHYADLIKKILNSEGFYRKSQTVENQYQSFDSKAQIAEIADHCQQLL